MAEIRTSGFKMLNKTPYKVPPPEPIITIMLSGLNEIEKTYGPVFTIRFIRHALQFEAQKIGEKTNKDIKTFDQLADYLISKTDRYPTPYCSILYAEFKTENDLEGQSGAGTRVGLIGAIRDIPRTLNSIKRDVDVDNILTEIDQDMTELDIGPSEWGYKQNEDGSVDLVIRKCHLLDACRLAYDENVLKRPGDGLVCVFAFAVTEHLKTVTSYDWDYSLLTFDDPHCIAQCYML